MKRYLLPLFLGGCAFLGGLAAVALARNGPTVWAQTTGQSSADPDRLEEKFEAVAAKIGPCVVSIEAVKTA
ncbi:MAG TPA: serine endoprotease, partial [Gemmataceae bacterium]|nr:serine endoprotease [Gemmataceae bacterium]